MQWSSFFLGILAGWIIQWVVDLLFWRKRQKRWVADESELQTRVSEAQTELEGRKADLAAAQAEMERLRVQLAASESERETLAAQFSELTDLAATAPAAAGVALAAMARGEPVVLEEISLETGDDLTMIEGIGPKIQELLNQQGIQTFAELADTDVERLQAVLQEGGPAFRMADPSSWPRQARLAANRDWVRLQSVKEQLSGGVRRPAPEEPPTPDDLTMIEGIGPKIQELLNQEGIQTFAELADTDVEGLQAVLQEGGPAFRMADPSSWPRQARLAANRDWVRLQSVKEQLSGGVRRPAAPEREDDLTQIEGIGPKIAVSLKEQGIRTFAQLAQTDPERLRAILGEAGPTFRLALPTVESWPEQARLAADGDWDQLHALQAELKAGREGSV